MQDQLIPDDAQIGEIYAAENGTLHKYLGRVKDVYGPELARLVCNTNCIECLYSDPLDGEHYLAEHVCLDPEIYQEFKEYIMTKEVIAEIIKRFTDSIDDAYLGELATENIQVHGDTIYYDLLVPQPPDSITISLSENNTSSEQDGHEGMHYNEYTDRWTWL